MDVQQQINALWNGAAPEYDRAPRHGLSFPEEEAAWKGALTALMPAAPADVLDVGTGTGFLALLLSELGHRVRGVDLAEGMLAHARSKAAERRLAVTFEVGDAMDPSGEDGSVDALVSRHVFWTLTDPERALRNWRRLLRPSGRLVIIDGLWSQNEQSEHTLAFQDALPMTAVSSLDAVKALVSGAGFVDVGEATLGGVAEVEVACWEKTDELRYVLTARR